LRLTVSAAAAAEGVAVRVAAEAAEAVSIRAGALPEVRAVSLPPEARAERVA
jgi:hypothetical protein